MPRMNFDHSSLPRISRDSMMEQFNPYHGDRDLIRKRGLYLSIHILRQAGARIITTNYDTMIEDVLFLKEMDWQHQMLPTFFSSATPVQDRMVFHIHGIYNRPAGVILGAADYRELSQTAIAPHPIRGQNENLLRTMLLQDHVLFVGCGETTQDPHFSDLFDFCAPTSGLSRPRHVHLCRDVDFETMSRILPSSIQPVPYGDYDNLGLAIKKLFPQIFGPLDAELATKQRDRVRAERRREKNWRLNASHVEGFVLLNPSDGLINDYYEFEKYYHVYEEFDWKKLPPPLANETGELYRKNVVRHRNAGMDETVRLAVSITDAVHDYHTAIASASTTITSPSGTKQEAADAFCRSLQDSPRDGNFRGVLHYLVHHAQHDLLETILNSPTRPRVFDINRIDSDGMTPLHFAVFLGRTREAQLLVDCDDIDVHSKDLKGRTPFKMAWRHGDKEMMRILAPRTTVQPGDPENMVLCLNSLHDDPNCEFREWADVESSDDD